MIYDITPVNNYTGNNSTTTFEFDFYIDNEDQLKVTLFDKQNFQHILTNGIDYSIDEIKNKNGSYITYPLSSSDYGILSDKEKISLELTLPISQETQYNNSSLLNLEALEYSFDYLTRLIQILSRKQELSIKVSEFSDKTPEELYNELNSSATYVAQAAQDINEKYNELNNVYQDIIDNKDKFDQIPIIEENLNSIESNLETKLNTNLSNLASQEKKDITSWSFPTNNYIDISTKFTAEGSMYISDHVAPANGYVFFYCSAGADNGLVSLTNITAGNIFVDNRVIGAGYASALLIPVAKNDNYRFAKQTTSGVAYNTRFIYAQGEI